MTRVLWLLLLVSVATGCDIRAFFLDTDALPGQREGAALACCTCLAERVSLDPRDRCTAERPETDGGVPRSRCLCDDIEADVCAELLLSGGGISPVGACVLPGGLCQAACDGVLAYP